MYAHLIALSPLHSTARASPAFAAYSRRLPVQTYVYLYIIGRIYVAAYMWPHKAAACLCKHMYICTYRPHIHMFVHVISSWAYVYICTGKPRIGSEFGHRLPDVCMYVSILQPPISTCVYIPILYMYTCIFAQTSSTVAVYTCRIGCIQMPLACTDICLCVYHTCHISIF